LLAAAGYQFDVIPAEVDEQKVQGNSPSELAQCLAMAKAEAIAEQHPGAAVLGADTIVCLGERVLGKPVDVDHARKMLELLSGTTQIVITGVCVTCRESNFLQSTRVLSAVRMDELSREQIDKYLASGDWQGKAGGYGIQDNDPLVKRVSGSHSNIVGLPMEIVRKILTRVGITPAKPEAT
jgi:septum formation protein